ncbi:redoxin family protein [uncultured Sphingomonas sp.]|uniref:redoxin family protein n=1 Tax=uncultured Sphingomonas sp. TaxID=158754 RepID=UPI0035CC03D9
MKRALVWTPLAAFALLFAVVAAGLFRPADRTIRSGIVGKPVPAFALASLLPGRPGLSSGDLRGSGPRVVNVFASWCAPCIAEAPQLMALKRAGVAVEGVAVRDTAPALGRFLVRNGDPFGRIGDDRASAVQLALGAAGVPESFVVDARGIITYQHVGYITPADVDVIRAEIERAR